METGGADEDSEEPTGARAASGTQGDSGQLGGEDREGSGGAGGGKGFAEGPTGGIPNEAELPDELDSLPSQSPLFHAQNAGRYDRQQLIKRYQRTLGAA